MAFSVDMHIKVTAASKAAKVTALMEAVKALFARVSMLENPLPYRANACVVVFNSRGEVLGCERVHDKGVFQFPQGGIDEGEAPEAAALRELHEEIGIRPTQIEFLGRIPGDDISYIWSTGPKRGYIGQSQSFFLCYVSAVKEEAFMAAIDLSGQGKGKEFRSVRWMSWEDALKCCDMKRHDAYSEVRRRSAEKMRKAY